jgi:hypothetical protein
VGYFTNALIVQDQRQPGRALSYFLRHCLKICIAGGPQTRVYKNQIIASPLSVYFGHKPSLRS